MLHRSFALASTLAVASAMLIGFGVAAAPPAAAQTTSGWADWSPISGVSNDYRTTMQLPGLGFPRADVASDSRGPVQLAGGTSTFLGGPTDAVPTPVGARYGSSRGHAYLNLRPRADTATTPSTTTYTFDTPTPAAGWAFVLGDIDADQVRVSASDAEGRPVDAAAVDSWFRGAFNYAGASDLPRWQPTDSTLVGNTGALDTNGASGWFEPNVALSSLTFVYTRRSGFPVYQTWFADLTRSVSGTVADVSTAGSCTIAQTTVRLLGTDGAELATTHPQPSGAYLFAQVATRADYTVAVDAPAGCAVVGPDERPVSTATDDGVADFGIRAIVPQPVSGTVTTATDGAPVAGATVTLTAPGGATSRTTVTDEQGRYLFDGNAVGDGYVVALTPPAGYRTPDPASRTVDVNDVAITGQDFTLEEQPTVSGTVTGGGDALGGVTVTLTPTSGDAVTTSTRGDGSYTFDRVSAGEYSISVTPPDGYRAPMSRDVSVGGADVTGADFDLDRPGALGGTVTDASGTARGGIEVVVHGPGTTRTLTTDTDGDFFADDLTAGTWTITARPATGDRVSPTARTAVITAAGEVRGGQDFTLSAAATSPQRSPSPPRTSPSTSPSPVIAAGSNGAGGAGGQSLADTGAPLRGPLAAGLALVFLGAALTAAGTHVGRTRRLATRRCG